MAGNEDALIRMSDGTTNAALNFMNGENFKRILTDLETGLDKLGKYVNGPDFNNDLNNFARTLQRSPKLLAVLLALRLNSWLFGAAVLPGRGGLVLWQLQQPELPPVLSVEVFLGLQPEQ